MLTDVAHKLYAAGNLTTVEESTSTVANAQKNAGLNTHEQAIT